MLYSFFHFLKIMIYRHTPVLKLLPYNKSAQCPISILYSIAVSGVLSLNTESSKDLLRFLHQIRSPHTKYRWLKTWLAKLFCNARWYEVVVCTGVNGCLATAGFSDRAV